MDSFFEKIRVRYIILIYIISIIAMVFFVQIPTIKNIVSKDSTFGDIIISTFVIVGLLIVSFKNQKVSSNKFMSCIKSIEWKKIVKLYILSITLFIGVILLISPIISINTWDYSNKNIFSSVFYFIVLAPIIEEFIFRGIILNRFKKKYNQKSVIIISSILFALLHFDPNVFSRFLLGLLASLLYIETKNIINCMIFHSLNNLTVLAFFLGISKCNLFNKITSKNNKIFIVTGVIFIIISIIANASYMRGKWKNMNK